MKMQKMTKEEFLSFIKDQRKDDIIRKRPVEVYFHNPLDENGHPSSFVCVMIHELGKNKSNVYCGVSKYNTDDTKTIKRVVPDTIPKKQQAKYKPSVTVSGFSLDEGLRQACNRAWREMMDMPSLYGRNHGPSAVKPKVSIMIKLNRVTSFPPSPFMPLMHPLPLELRKELANAQQHLRQRLIGSKPIGETK